MTDVQLAEGTTEQGRRRPVVRWVAGFLAVTCLALVALLATRQPAATRVADSPLIGRLAPEISGTTLDGRSLRLSGLRGEFVLLNFFATWCVPCQREHPEIRDFAAADETEVLAVVFDDEPARVKKFFEERGGTWPVVEDPRGKVALDYGVRGPPESFLIAPSGIVIARIVGEVSREGLADLLAEARGTRA
jgi:cytochrome c biogenesis protein CcmG, thiol:disulfide interchange protein DsbE